jgi:hypothetical protein
MGNNLKAMFSRPEGALTLKELEASQEHPRAFEGVILEYAYARTVIGTAGMVDAGKFPLYHASIIMRVQVPDSNYVQLWKRDYNASSKAWIRLLDESDIKGLSLVWTVPEQQRKVGELPGPTFPFYEKSIYNCIHFAKEQRKFLEEPPTVGQTV